MLGVGILLAEGDEHKVGSSHCLADSADISMQRQRKDLMPAFHYRHVKDLYPVFWEKSTKLVNGLMSAAQKEGSVKTIGDAPIVEFSGWSSRATLDIIGRAGMGVDFDSIDNPDTKVFITFFSNTMLVLTQSLVDQCYIPNYLFTEPPAAKNGHVGVRTSRNSSFLVGSEITDLACNLFSTPNKQC